MSSTFLPTIFELVAAHANAFDDQSVVFNELHHGCAGVDTLAKRDKTNPERLKLLKAHRSDPKQGPPGVFKHSDNFQNATP